MIKVLFLCLHNSARSQMAEGFLRQFGGDGYEVHSAGSIPGGQLRPMAVQVMNEAGVDISRQKPKDQSLFKDHPLDYVITTCDEARESCPIFPGQIEQIHWRFDDPSAATGTEEEQLAVYRRVAREIETRVRLFVNATTPGIPAPAHQD